MSNLITPTKKSPVFTAHSDMFGSFDMGVYNNALVGNTTTAVFALKYDKAITALHEWLKDQDVNDLKRENATYSIDMIDGSVDKWGEIKRVKVYSITTAKAIKYLF